MAQRITKKFIQDFIRKHEIPVKDIDGEPLDGGDVLIKLEACPFNPEHKNGDAKIFCFSDNKVRFRCKHNSCEKYHLSHFIKHYEPDFYKDSKAQKSLKRDSFNPADLPEPVNYSDIAKDLPPLSPELIEGLLRQGHKMLLSGQSKAGKSFALIELAIALATGRAWFGFRCHKTKVLYLNLEVDQASFLHRIHDVAQRENVADQDMKDNLLIWNLRGAGSTISDLVDPVREYAESCGAVIVDPIYKVLEGDENSASDMAMFTKKLDAIAEGGASLIFCHHYGKATQTQYKDAFSRASGSGVFARDPDAIISMSSLDKTGITSEMRQSVQVGQDAEPFQVDCTLREFKPIKPFKAWFDYPVHILDNGALDGIGVDNGKRAKDGRTARRIAVLSTAFKVYQDQKEEDGGIPMRVLSGHVEGLNGGRVDEKQIRNYAKDSGGMFKVENGKLYQTMTSPEPEYDIHNLLLEENKK